MKRFTGHGSYSLYDKPFSKASYHLESFAHQPWMKRKSSYKKICRPIFCWRFFSFCLSLPSRYPVSLFLSLVGLLEWTEYNLNDGQKFNGLERITHSTLFQTLCLYLGGVFSVIFGFWMASKRNVCISRIAVNRPLAIDTNLEFSIFSLLQPNTSHYLVAVHLWKRILHSI